MMGMGWMMMRAEEVEMITKVSKCIRGTTALGRMSAKITISNLSQFS